LALSHLRVADLSTWIAGAYCTKLLADGGAEVIKVEAPAGDPLRRWSASGAEIDAQRDGPLFNFLHASKRSVVVDPGNDEELAALHDLLASSDIAVWSQGSPLSEHPDLQPDALRRRHPHLVVTAVTPFGLEGPWSGRAATEFTLQAWSGAVIGIGRGQPDRAPVYVGGQIGEWLAGLFAAIGALAAGWLGEPHGDLVDVSMLEALVTCLTYYPVTFNDQMGRPMRRKRFVPTPGVGAASDGLVGLGVGTGQQWLDFCAMVEHPEWTEEPKFFLDRTALAPAIDDWIAGHTVDEVLDLASAFRIPNGPIANGANAPKLDHFVARDTFVPNPRDGAANPRPPYRLGAAALRPPAPAAALGEHSIYDVLPRRSRHDGPAGGANPDAPADVASATLPRRLPFEGLRVLDMTAFWAGPLAGHVMALLGAEVIHLESAGRPDGVRLVGGVPQTEDRYWERGPIFAALNTNKKSLTLDLQTARGKELLRQFVRTCDVVIENYTPRVIDQLGLDYDTLRRDRPDLVMVRMPGFGLDGPWRDQAAFAFVIEDASGLTWLTGHPDLLPFEPYTVGDPNAGLHAVFGLLLALQHRRRTGEGGLVESAMVDAGLNVAAEQVIEHSASGNLLTRQGNRGPCAAPQNLYQTAKRDEQDREAPWVAIAVATDEQWRSLRRVLGEPDWAAGPELDTAAGRAEAHERIDLELAQWCGDRQADDVVSGLWGAGVPVAEVVQPHDQPGLPPLQARNFFEQLEHPVIGNSRYSSLPMKFEQGPERLHTRHAPLLGEHNHELLGELGLSSEDIDELEADGVIGTSLPSGA
jgi:crotonobetainyl-CoA:carnitine CoA-transferase CaiB-like acyl-CoA transferase